ncbi:MAG: hypothetical protein IJ991_14260 [Thermoguttaceae bacterium]|nr:hypothetical protein [Thermoguttaceae bacterium]
MKKSLNLAAFVVGVLGLTFAFVGAPSLALAQPAVTENLAVTLENRDIDRFKKQAERMAQGNVDLLWIGDSITHGWEGGGKDVWAEYYGDRNAMNFGISGDRTGHVLWRLENSPVDKINPKMTIIMIGTNNIGHTVDKMDGDNKVRAQHSSPAETVQGVQAVVDKVKALYPTTKILLLEVFPRDHKVGDKFRKDVDAINAGLRDIYAGGKVENVQLYSINDLFLTEDGTLPKEIMPDMLHPNAAGYKIWADALEPMIADGLGETPVDVQPAPREGDWWTGRFNEKNELLKKGDVDVLMVGDSITHGWEGAGADVWQKYYGDMKAINLGIGGDQTQHVLWRIENYDWSKVNPKLAVLLIGVNNTWSRDREPANIALGNRRIVTKLHSLFPEMKIIVLKIFPCTSRPDQQAEIDKINALMPYAVRDLDYVELVDINHVFMNKDGVLTKDVMPDLLHPNAVGYESWGAALYLKIQEKLAK